MFKFNLLKWCDEKITALKDNDIVFANGIPQLKEEHIYNDMPEFLSTYAYRNDIRDSEKKQSLLSFYMYEDRLWPRLIKIDDEIEVMKEYAGIVGFDLSLSILMVRPRQRLSILINAIYSCYCGIRGIKVLPNYRPGDFGTIEAAYYFPNNCNFIIGNHGCNRYGFREYGMYQMEIVLLKKSPKVLFVYGAMPQSYIREIINLKKLQIVTIPDRRNRVRNNRKPYLYYLKGNKVVKTSYANSDKGGVA